MPEASFFEQLQWLRAASEQKSPLARFGSHPVVGELERELVCVRCRWRVLVGPCFEHLDADSFVCGGCLELAGEVETGGLPGVSEGTGQDGTGREPSGAAAAAGTAGNGQDGDLASG